MINKVKELRQIVPIPANEALKLLKENDGDIEKCVYLFKAKSIRDICNQTGCDSAMANLYYEREKYDINRAVSFIRDELYDLNYHPIEGVTAEKVNTALEWLYIIRERDFAYSLSYKYLNIVIDVFSRIEFLQNAASLIEKAKAKRDIIFKGYSDAQPMKEFVRRHQKLDLDPDFREANRLIPLQLIVIAEELRRHFRHLQK